MTSLPAPRDILTALITSLSSPAPRGLTSTPNPLRDSPGEKATLLSTLHVLFPSLLLPALDLLDRGLVTRVVCRDRAHPESPQRASGGKGDQSGEGGEGTAARAQEGGSGHVGEAPRGGFHVVRSLASTMKRREGGYYIVFLDAWNCTCPSFAFDAFPPVSATSDSMKEDKSGGGGEADEAGETWTFGGLSTDGTEGFGASIPCCKHLLACVLAERWGDVLGSYVAVKVVGKGEMAGLVADV